MSTMVSSVYPLAENFHKDFQAGYFENIDVGFLTNAGGLSIDASDQFPLMNNVTSPAAWALQRPAGLTRRNSTSSVSSITSSRNRMSNNPLTSIANIIPETSTATITAAASILSSMPTTTEEKFRGRAYSEGANSLSMESALQAQQQPIASSRYKTELCRPFEENGKCKYGDKCQFAHGKQELRQLVRHPKYKTELCRTFHTSGFCPYGPRCHFIHNQEDLNKRGNNAMPSANVTQQTPQQNAFSMMPQRCAPVAVPTPHISERNHFDNRPSQLNLLKQLASGTAYGNMGYAPASPLGSSPPYYHGDISQTVLMSPTSPNSVSNGSIFNFNNVTTQADNIPVTTAGLINMLSGMQQHSPTSSNFDMFRSQGMKNETTVNDDSAFDGTPTPPDSDRESLTGSPPEKQRLPIFRCLSQSD